MPCLMASAIACVLPYIDSYTTTTRIVHTSCVLTSTIVAGAPEDKGPKVPRSRPIDRPVGTGRWRPRPCDPGDRALGGRRPPFAGRARWRVDDAHEGQC